MSNRGHTRERAVKNRLQDNDWFVIRTAGSFGACDLVALKAGKQPLLIEVKSTAGGPYEHFGPNERALLAIAAQLAGATALLAWWPPRGQLRWIPATEWPKAAEEASP
jgi:Holliday junction resolvase